MHGFANKPSTLTYQSKNQMDDWLTGRMHIKVQTSERWVCVYSTLGWISKLGVELWRCSCEGRLVVNAGCGGRYSTSPMVLPEDADQEVRVGGGCGGVCEARRDPGIGAPGRNGGMQNASFVGDGPFSMLRSVVGVPGKLAREARFRVILDLKWTIMLWLLGVLEWFSLPESLPLKDFSLTRCFASLCHCRSTRSTFFVRTAFL